MELNYCFLPLPLLILLLLSPCVSAAAQDDYRYVNCSKPFTCGDTEAEYPFWGGSRAEYCGRPGFKLECESDQTTITPESSPKFRILELKPEERRMRVAREDLLNNTCFLQIPLSDISTFQFAPGTINLTLNYNCANSLQPQSSLYCNFNGDNVDLFLPVSLGSNKTCRSNFTIPIPEAISSDIMRGNTSFAEALKEGFEVEWDDDAFEELCKNCTYSGGECGFDQAQSQFACFCADQSYSDPRVCSRGEGTTSRHGLIIVIIAVGLLVIVAIGLPVIVAMGLLVMTRYKSRRLLSSRKRLHDGQNIEAFLQNYGSLAPKVYRYSHVKRMACSFSEKLGEGGFGDVYKGKLSNGRVVAIKLLKNSKGTGEDFLNEIASISRTSHVNVVTLLGFCHEGKNRALIYEYMANGSLDKFIYQERPFREMDRKLGWNVLWKIAIGIARGLEYLHRGCNTRILHFDIKPHNILLDEEFCPKISDFGLAKLCEGKESIVSMLGARGTMGYIAPEVYCRNFGEVSHKSDVYSYGMLVLEMVGGRKNVDAGASRTSKIYFPSWIYEHADIGDEIELLGITTEDEEKRARKMVLVSLWCIQAIPSERPSMTKVVEMLEGSLEALQVPPKPLLTSSKRIPN